jgi:hypothetical protein
VPNKVAEEQTVHSGEILPGEFEYIEVRWLVARLAAIALAVAALLPARGAFAAPNYLKTPAGITDAARDSTYDDFMRMLWVPPTTQVTYIGRHDAAVTNLRAFFTATTFIKPAVTVDQYAALVGNNYQTDNDLVLMRCRPTPDQEQSLDSVLATWPNVLAAVVTDFQNRGYSCPPPDPSDGNNVMYCAAQSYQDTQQAVFVKALSTALDIANQIFQNSPSSPGALALKTNYGIYPAFNGLGFAAAGSGTVSGMNAETILRESIVSEYLVENLSLADADCRCIQVPKYGNRKTDDVRHTKPVDPNYVWQKGKLTSDGACRQIKKLGKMTQNLDPAALQGSAADATASDQ